MAKQPDYRKCAHCHDGRMIYDRTVGGYRIYRCDECGIAARASTLPSRDGTIALEYDHEEWSRFQ
jgi:hypothetical protein